MSPWNTQSDCKLTSRKTISSCPRRSAHTLPCKETNFFDSKRTTSKPLSANLARCLSFTGADPARSSAYMRDTRSSLSSIARISAPRLPVVPVNSTATGNCKGFVDFGGTYFGNADAST